MLRAFPAALIALRALLGPTVVLLAWQPAPAWGFALALMLAFVSDVADGMIARRLGVATAGLRRADSAADTLFYACALVAAWHVHPEVIAVHARALVVLAALEVGRYAFDLARYGREASYHMWSSKLWGVLLCAGFLEVLAFDRVGAFAAAAIYWGIACDLEGLAISMVLGEWRNDVPSLMHALRIRSGARA